MKEVHLFSEPANVLINFIWINFQDINSSIYFSQLFLITTYLPKTYSYLYRKNVFDVSTLPFAVKEYENEHYLNISIMIILQQFVFTLQRAINGEKMNEQVSRRKFEMNAELHTILLRFTHISVSIFFLI